MLNRLKYILLSGCLSLLAPSAIADNRAVDRFAEVVDSLHRHVVFPHNLGPGIVLANVGVDKNEKMLVINYTLNPEFVDAVAENIASENGIAQLLTGYDEIFSTSMIEAEAGCKAILTSPSADGLNKSKIVTVPPAAIPIVYTRLKNGDYSPLQPYLEMLKSTFSNMRFPVQITSGISLTDAYVGDKEAHWIYEIAGEMDASDITEELIRHNRLNLVNNLRSTISQDYLNEIEEKGITLYYKYLNERGEVIFEFAFTADDLK